MLQETPRIGEKPLETANRNVREAAVQPVAKLGAQIADGKSPLSEALQRDNNIAALAADFGGAMLSKPDTAIQCAPGAIFSRPVTLTQSARMVGAWFKGNDGGVLANVSNAAATAIFVGCRFTKPSGANGDYITVANGARAHFIGCLFDGVQAANFAVNNAGAAGNVFIIGCSDKTTVGHNSVTVIAETT